VLRSAVRTPRTWLTRTMPLPDSIESYIQPGERVLWRGRPVEGLRLRPSDAFLIPFSMLWGGFAIAWECMALFAAPKGTAIAYLFPVWGIPFVLVGLYMIVGRFFDDAWLRSKTDYVVTDRRILILTGRWTRRLVSLDLRNLPPMTLTSRSNGLGSIAFGVQPYGFGRRPGFPQPPTLDLIADARSVQALIEGARVNAR
jgi:hypothetical protein